MGGDLGVVAGAGGTFEAMNTPWKIATMYLAVVDLVAAVGLWLRAAWGNVLWIYAALSEVAMHTVFIGHLRHSTCRSSASTADGRRLPGADDPGAPRGASEERRSSRSARATYAVVNRDMSNFRRQRAQSTRNLFVLEESVSRH